MIKNLLILTLLIFCLNCSCTHNIEKYKIKINTELWKTEPINPMKEFDDKYLNDGKLHIDFQYYFKNDTAVIKKMVNTMENMS